MAKMKVANVTAPKMQEKFLSNTILKVSLVLASVFFMSVAMAQPEQGPVQMADGMRSNGKIYVVVAVLLTVLIGLFLYVIRLDRKISKLEKQSD